MGSPRSPHNFHFNTFNSNCAEESAAETGGGGSAVVGRVRIAHQPQGLSGSTRAAPVYEPGEQRKKGKSASWGKKEMFERFIKGAEKPDDKQQQQRDRSRKESEKERKNNNSISNSGNNQASEGKEWRAAAVKPPPPPTPTTPTKVVASPNNTSPPSGASRIGLMPAPAGRRRLLCHRASSLFLHRTHTHAHHTTTLNAHATQVRNLAKLMQSVERRIDNDRVQLGRRNSDGSLSAGAGEAREILEGRLSALTAALAALRTIKL